MTANEPRTQERTRTVSEHPDTIGEIEWGGKTYQVDWPFDLDDETTRDELLAVIYLDGKLVGEFNQPFGRLTSKAQVMSLAWEYVTNGETDDQS